MILSADDAVKPSAQFISWPSGAVYLLRSSSFWPKVIVRGAILMSPEKCERAFPRTAFWKARLPGAVFFDNAWKGRINLRQIPFLHISMSVTLRANGTYHCKSADLFLYRLIRFQINYEGNLVQRETEFPSSSLFQLGMRAIVLFRRGQLRITHPDDRAKVTFLSALFPIKIPHVIYETNYYFSILYNFLFVTSQHFACRNVEIYLE